MELIHCFADPRGNSGIPVQPILKSQFSDWINRQSATVKNWLQANQFKAQSGSVCLLPDAEGRIERVYLGIQDEEDFWVVGDLPSKLGEGIYHFINDNENPWVMPKQKDRAVLAWGLGSYSFNRYSEKKPSQAQLWIEKEQWSGALPQWVKAIYWVRDLINTPTEDLGPAELVKEAEKLAKEFSAAIKILVGEELLEANYQMIYTVGRASPRAPRLIDMQWGETNAPKVTLVGKGVCFDSGGLNIKSGSGMRDMKKDMAGAAHVLGLARMIMQQNLPVRLRVLIPAVENLVSGNSYLPGDIITARSGLRVEVTNTDAEGRLILSDALSEAMTEKPAHLIDIATLTGAARVALGPEVSVFFSNNEKFAEGVQQVANQTGEPMWRLPLYAPYARYLKSDIADCCNAADTGHGGAITAALYLQKFVNDEVPWMHLDIMAWNEKGLSGRPSGGEAMGLRTLFDYLAQQYLG